MKVLPHQVNFLSYQNSISAGKLNICSLYHVTLVHSKMSKFCTLGNITNQEMGLTKDRSLQSEVSDLWPKLRDLWVLQCLGWCLWYHSYDRTSQFYLHLNSKLEKKLIETSLAWGWRWSKSMQQTTQSLMLSWWQYSTVPNSFKALIFTVPVHLVLCSTWILQTEHAMVIKT